MEKKRIENVKIKKYFYVLRPVLAGRWIEEYNEFPPLNFEKLLAEVVPEGELKNQITTLFERKIRGDELDLEPRIDVINTFLNTEIDRLEKYAKTVRVDIPDPTKQLYELFRDTLNQVWVTQNL